MSGERRWRGRPRLRGKKTFETGPAVMCKAWSELEEKASDRGRWGRLVAPWSSWIGTD